MGPSAVCNDDRFSLEVVSIDKIHCCRSSLLSCNTQHVVPIMTLNCCETSVQLGTHKQATVTTTTIYACRRQIRVFTGNGTFLSCLLRLFLSTRYIKKSLQIPSANLTQKCSTVGQKFAVPVRVFALSECWLLVSVCLIGLLFRCCTCTTELLSKQTSKPKETSTNKKHILKKIINSQFYLLSGHITFTA